MFQLKSERFAFNSNFLLVMVIILFASSLVLGKLFEPIAGAYFSPIMAPFLEEATKLSLAMIFLILCRHSEEIAISETGFLNYLFFFCIAIAIPLGIYEQMESNSWRGLAHGFFTGIIPFIALYAFKNRTSFVLAAGYFTGVFFHMVANSFSQMELYFGRGLQFEQDVYIFSLILILVFMTTVEIRELKKRKCRKPLNGCLEV